MAGTNIEKNERDGVSKDLDNVVVEDNDKLEYEAAHDELEKMRAGSESAITLCSMIKYWWKR